MLKYSAAGKVCSFCGTPWSPELRFAGGLGAMMCEECVVKYAEIFASPRKSAEVARPPWELMPDQELLDTLPRIVANAEQVTVFLGDWVRLIRARRLTWRDIGQALGVSKQAAWERFRHIESRSPSEIS